MRYTFYIGIILLIIQFVPTKNISPVSTGYVNGKIAHINIDTIMTKYPLVDTLQNRLQRQITSLETDLINRQSRLQKTWRHIKRYSGR